MGGDLEALEVEVGEVTSLALAGGGGGDGGVEVAEDAGDVVAPLPLLPPGAREALDEDLSSADWESKRRLLRCPTWNSSPRGSVSSVPVGAYSQSMGRPSCCRTVFRPVQRTAE